MISDEVTTCVGNFNFNESNNYLRIVRKVE